MRRLTAKLLLLFALVGSLLPLALAATSAPRACCLRKGVHRCQDSPASQSEPPILRDATCRNRESRRAVTTAQSAHARSKLAAFVPPAINVRPAGTEPNSLANASAEFQSSRAPPSC